MMPSTPLSPPRSHPNTVAAFKARMESVVRHKKVLTPAETQIYSSSTANPMVTRLVQLAVPSPQRLEAIPHRMRSASPNREQLRDRMGSIQYRRVVDIEGELPFEGSDEIPNQRKESFSTPIRGGYSGAGSDAESASQARAERDALLFVAKSAADRKVVANEPYLSALAPDKYCRISPSPNSFVNLSPREKKERLRVVSPQARKYVCEARERFSPEHVSQPLAYAIYGTAMKDPDTFGGGVSVGEGSTRATRSGNAMTSEEQIKSILRSEKRKTATTIGHEHYTLLRNLFEEIDEDGSGFLELRELLQFRARFPKRLPENVLHGLKLEQDGKVYLDDFLSTFYPCVSQETIEQLMTAFEPKAKDLTSISAQALRELNAYYNNLRHSFWDFTLETYARGEGPFDLNEEHARQLRKAKKRSIQSAKTVDAYVGSMAQIDNTSFSSTASRPPAPYYDLFTYHSSIYRRRHRREKHADACHYFDHPSRINDKRVAQKEARTRSHQTRLLRATWLARRSIPKHQREEGEGDVESIVGSDTDSSDISTSSCSCDDTFGDFSSREATGNSRALNAYQWYLHEAQVLSQTQGDATIGAFIAKLRMREVPLKPVIPNHLRHLLTGSGNSIVRPRGLSSLGCPLVTQPVRRKSKGQTAVSLLSPSDLMDEGEDHLANSRVRQPDRSAVRSSSVGLRFQMTPFVDGDTTKPNIPYLLSCPISLKDFARVAMDYSVKKEANQSVDHFDVGFAERLEQLRWHKMFPYTGDVRHFFKRFPNGLSDDELSDDDDKTKIPSYIRRGAGVTRKMPFRNAPLGSSDEKDTHLGANRPSSKSLKLKR